MEVVQSVVDQNPSAPTQVGIFWHQGRIRILLIKILVDDAGLEKDLPVVVEHRDFAIGVELQKFGPLLVLFARLSVTRSYARPFSCKAIFVRSLFDDGTASYKVKAMALSCSMKFLTSNIGSG